MKTSNTTSTRLAFARTLRRRREALSLSQESLAEQAGLHRTYVSSVERGQRNITIDNIHRLARALGVRPHELLVEDET